VENVLKIVTLYRLLGVEELKELLHELWGHIDLQAPDLNSFIDHKLQEELIDPLEMRPGGVGLLLLLDTSLRQSKIVFLNIGERPKDILFDHGHYIIKMGYNKRHHCFLILQISLNLVYSV